MTPAEAFLTVLRDAHAMLQTVMNDIDRDALWRRPPGNANPIGEIYGHAVGVEDMYIQQIIQGKPTVWESGGWAAKLGRETPPNLWQGEAPRPFDLFDFLGYRRAVYSASELYIAGLSAEDLDRALPFPGRDWSMSLAQLLTVVVSHCTAHAGEIAALRGVFGGKGLPY
ncbi:MAG TPA: DinB family protein [Dehalococcoidia bacterium]|nr:DinB family protein [Dehalococcoidia bacterium]